VSAGVCLRLTRVIDFFHQLDGLYPRQEYTNSAGSKECTNSTSSMHELDGLYARQEYNADARPDHAQGGEQGKGTEEGEEGGEGTGGDGTGRGMGQSVAVMLQVSRGHKGEEQVGLGGGGGQGEGASLKMSPLEKMWLLSAIVQREEASGDDKIT
jgi:hypothetical protein